MKGGQTFWYLRNPVAKFEKNNFWDEIRKKIVQGHETWRFVFIWVTGQDTI